MWLYSIGVRLPSPIKVGIVECKQILVLIVKTLDSMCLPLREVPDVSKTKLADLITTVLIDRRHKDTAKQNLSPFGLCSQHKYRVMCTRSTYHTMPVQFTDCALG